MARHRMREAGVVLTATNTLIAELAQNWATPQGAALTKIMFTGVLPINPIADERLRMNLFQPDFTRTGRR